MKMSHCGGWYEVNRYGRSHRLRDMQETENQGSSLSLVVTPEGRRKLNARLTPISIKCSSFYSNEFKIDVTSNLVNNKHIYNLL